MSDLPLPSPFSAGPRTFGALDEPPAELVPQPFSERLYNSLAPLAKLDPENAWALLIFCNAVGSMYELVEAWVRDTEEGPGWSLLLDLERCPDEALPWLGQFVGVRVSPGLSPDDQRLLIAATVGFRRGTVASLREAAALTLTGAKTVYLRERAGDPGAEPIDYAYRLTAHTYESQTPDPAKTLAAFLSQKPAALVLDYQTVPGQTWRQLRDSGKTWAQVKAAYATWGDVRAHEPA